MPNPVKPSDDDSRSQNIAITAWETSETCLGESPVKYEQNKMVILAAKFKGNFYAAIVTKTLSLK